MRREYVSRSGLRRRRSTYAILLLLVFVALLAGPAGGGPAALEESQYKSPSQLVAGPEGELLYIAETTANEIAVVEIGRLSVVKRISLQDRPTGLTLSSDGIRLYVTGEAAEGKVYVLDTQTGAALGSIEVGHTPGAPTLSRDGGTLYVCNRFDNDVSVIDLSSETERTRIQVTREPVAASLSADGKRLFVANQLPAGPANGAHISAVISVVDTKEQRVVDDIRLPDGSTGLRGLALSPDGDYLYVTHLLSRHHLPTSQIERGWIQTNALSIVDAKELEFVNTVLLDDVGLGAANPWGIGCTSDGKYLCVTHAGTHEASVIDRIGLHKKLQAAARGEQVSEASSSAADVKDDLSFLAGLRTRVRLAGTGPRGLQVVGDRAYVAEYFSDSIGVIDLSSQPQVAGSVPLGADVRLTAERRGEMVFHDARHCQQQWLSCASCHPYRAGPDGLNWDLMLDGVGNPKNTKSLLLAHQTPPTTITGARASAEVSVRSGFKHIQFSQSSDEDASAVDAYLKSLQPLPSPYLVRGKMSPEAARGKIVFKSDGCDSCHRPPLYTDLRKYDVGAGRGQEEGVAFDTPTLIEAWRTAPYLYDGRAATLEDLFTSSDSGSSHNVAPRLSEQQIADLAVFVGSL
jgi:YVTN family beta-propeller protein